MKNKKCSHLRSNMYSVGDITGDNDCDGTSISVDTSLATSVEYTGLILLYLHCP